VEDPDVPAEAVASPADTLSLLDQVHTLADRGLDIAVTVAPGTITAEVIVGAAAAGLLPALLRVVDGAGITRTPGGARITGSMCQGTVHLSISVSSAHVTVAQLEAMVAQTATIRPAAATCGGALRAVVSPYDLLAG